MTGQLARAHVARRVIVVSTFSLILFLLLMPSGAMAKTREVIGTFDGQNYLIQAPAKNQKPPPNGWPILLFFHGYNERGDDIGKLRYNNTPAGVYRDVADLHDHFVVITPQLKREARFWDPVWTRNLIRQALKNWPVDWSRLAVTGLSIGGTGVWDFVRTYPEDVWSAAAFSAVAQETLVDPLSRPFAFDYEKPLLSHQQRQSQALAHVPFFQFHCRADWFIPFRAAARMAVALRRIGNRSSRVVPVPDCGHGAWLRYLGRDRQDLPGRENISIYDWLLEPD